jgi:hypothetical protein
VKFFKQGFLLRLVWGLGFSLGLSLYGELVKFFKQGFLLRLVWGLGFSLYGELVKFFKQGFLFRLLPDILSRITTTSISSPNTW